MKNYQTRSERHIRKQTNTWHISSTKLVSLAGIGLLAMPIAANLAKPQTANASEYYQSTQTAQGFVEQLGWVAQEVAAANDLYASVMLAQALLESGNGTSLLASAPYYNLFGVKGSYNGQTVYLPTEEYLNGQWVVINEPFRQYQSYWESFQDHANVLRSTSFTTGTPHYSGAWKSQTTAYYDATNYLTGRYATDPSYGQKLNWLIETYQLTRFDTPSYSETTTAAVTETSFAAAETSTASGQVYTVVAGDTLWDIANKFGLTVDQLMTNNGLSNDVIMVGDQLAV